MMTLARMWSDDQRRVGGVEETHEFAAQVPARSAEIVSARDASDRLVGWSPVEVAHVDRTAELEGDEPGDLQRSSQLIPATLRLMPAQADREIDYLPAGVLQGEQGAGDRDALVVGVR
nr:hypothetical protein [Pseudonocardia sp.]